MLFRSNGLVGSPCSPRDSQESSPTPQFKSINSLALSLLYGPILISVHSNSSSVSHSVVCDSLQPHGLQHARLPSLALFPGVCSDSCPLSGCCYLTISSSATHFSCPQSFPAEKMSWLLCIRWPKYESALHIRWPKYWSFSSSSEYSGLISFRI